MAKARACLRTTSSQEAVGSVDENNFGLLVERARDPRRIPGFGAVLLLAEDSVSNCMSGMALARLETILARANRKET